MARLRYNGLKATLGGSGLTAAATAITFASTLQHLTNQNVPTIVAPDYIPLCLLSPTTGLVNEIVNLTAYTAGGTTGTIARAQEGSTGVTHAAGDTLVQDITAADFGVVLSYVPVWSCVTAPQPVLGTGGTAVGFYSLHGPLCYFTLTITLGTSGFTAGGGGQYSLTLPLTPTRDSTVWGTIRIGGNPYPFVADVNNSGNTIPGKVLPNTAGNPTINWTSANPGAPVASSVYRCSGTFFWTT